MNHLQSSEKVENTEVLINQNESAQISFLSDKLVQKKENIADQKK